jgi:hypothetical protein
MPARRCAPCNFDWLATVLHGLCPTCGENTVYHAQSNPNAEAERLLRHAEFEHFYAERGEREVEMDWSRIDAALEEIRALEAIPVAGEPIEVEPLSPERWGESAYLLDSVS